MKARNGLLHLIRSAIVDFKRNKIRTLLTSLGIMIGVLSVVMLIALGLGLRNYIEEQFESLGSNLLFIMPMGSLSGEEGLSSSFGGMIGGIQFDERDVAKLKRISNVEYTVPVFIKSIAVEAEGEKERGYVMGINEDVFKALNLEPEEGKLLTKTDIQRKSKNVVLGIVIAENLFGSPSKAIGKTVRFNNQRFKVVGVIKKKGDPDMDGGVFMSYKTTFGSLNPNKTFFSIYLGVESEEDIPAVKKEAEEVLLKRYEDEEFSVSEQAEILSMVNTIFSVINSVLIAIGSISLLVGGIGIMNIMYASVTERTKEVGIRRAVGATERDILNQFLTESVLLSVFGGALGLLFAALIVMGIRIFFPAAINLFSVIITFVISSAIGIFFGVFPARRAAKLPPIEAIRYE